MSHVALQDEPRLGYLMGDAVLQGYKLRLHLRSQGCDYGYRTAKDKGHEDRPFHRFQSALVAHTANQPGLHVRIPWKAAAPVQPCATAPADSTAGAEDRMLD